MRWQCRVCSSNATSKHFQQLLLSKLELSTHYVYGENLILAWNPSSPIIKRGIAITPVKFGVSFTATLFNQAGALVHVYTDSSVQVNHGGTEMGQGLNTKVAQRKVFL